MRPAGIEPATFLFVAQHLNHCATAINSSTVCIFFFTFWCKIHDEIWRGESIYTSNTSTVSHSTTTNRWYSWNVAQWQGPTAPIHGNYFRFTRVLNCRWKEKAASEALVTTHQTRQYHNPKTTYKAQNTMCQLHYSNCSCNLMLHMYIHIPGNFLPRTSFTSNCCTKIFFHSYMFRLRTVNIIGKHLIWIILVILHIH